MNTNQDYIVRCDRVQSAEASLSSSICTIPTIEPILGGVPVVGDIGLVMASTQRR